MVFQIRIQSIPNIQCNLNDYVLLIQATEYAYLISDEMGGRIRRWTSSCDMGNPADERRSIKLWSNLYIFPVIGLSVVSSILDECDDSN